MKKVEFDHLFMFYLLEVDLFQVIMQLNIKCIYVFCRHVQFKCIYKTNTVRSKDERVSLSSNYANDK